MSVRAGLVLGIAIFACGAADKIKVLIVDGQNNHAWAATTPLIKAILENAEIFTVDVSTTPKDLAEYKGGTRAVAAPAATARRCTQHRRKIGTRRVQRRHQTERDTDNDRERRGEPEHTGVDRNLIDARQSARAEQVAFKKKAGQAESVGNLACGRGRLLLR